MSFLNLSQKNVLVFGASNKKSVATFSADLLAKEGANVLFSVESEEHKERVLKMFPNSMVFIANLADSNHINKIKEQLETHNIMLDGILHSVAFARLTPGQAFHDSPWENYAEAVRISQFSLVEISGKLKERLNQNASVVTVGISDDKATSYGMMGPIKSMLHSSVSYLAKSFSSFSHVRFNAVCSGPLKTSASAGIPGYIENYLYSEQMTLRKRALETREVANTIVYLLSEASSGINGTEVVVDAGMRCNAFDETLVSAYSKNQL